MHTEADIAKSLLDTIGGAGQRALLLANWPKLAIAPVAGTAYSMAKFSDGSLLYVATAGSEAVADAELAEEFFEGFAGGVMQWLLATPTESWPKAIREAYGKAAARDPFAASVWEDVARAKRAKP